MLGSFLEIKLTSLYSLNNKYKGKSKRSNKISNDYYYANNGPSFIEMIYEITKFM